MNKSRKIIALTLLTSLIVYAALGAMSVNAQSQATVNILASVGGTTDPTPGEHTYYDGTSVTFTATPDGTFVFQNWIISTDQGSSSTPEASVVIPVVGGTTYTLQAIFVQVLAFPYNVTKPVAATDAIIQILAAAGGTTDPIPGTYTLANATNLMLTAKPASGWQFDHWVIEGPNLSHGGYPFTATPTDNPYNVNHGYGNMFSYQPVFTPVGSVTPTPSGATPTPTVPEFSSAATIVAALAIVALAFGTYAYRRKTK